MSILKKLWYHLVKNPHVELGMNILLVILLGLNIWVK